MPPQRPYLILPTNIPNVELDILIRDGLDVEPDSRDGSDVLVEFEFVQDRCKPAISVQDWNGRAGENKGDRAGTGTGAPGGTY